MIWYRERGEKAEPWGPAGREARRAARAARAAAQRRAGAAAAATAWAQPTARVEQQTGRGGPTVEGWGAVVPDPASRPLTVFALSTARLAIGVSGVAV